MPESMGLCSAGRGWPRKPDGGHPAERPPVFVCGPTGVVETVADALVEVGHDPASIHAERFGPTG